MSLLMIGSFPLLMTIVLMIAVWAERFLADQDELVPIDDSYDKGLDVLTPQAGMAVPAARAAMVTKPEL
jgi:hypothetical protein